MEKIINKLFQIIRAAFDVEYPDISLTSEECEKIIAFGKKQSILPVIYAGLKKTDAPADVLKSVNDACITDYRRFILFDDALKRISRALGDADVDYIPLKGAVLRDLYPAPEMRTSSDIDVLVREEEIDRAIEAIEAQTDFKMDHRAFHDYSMLNPSVHLELHFNIKENMENIDKLLSKAWDFAEMTAEGSKYVFTPEFQIFHIIGHMSHHFLQGGLGIRPFLDLWLLRMKTQYNEDMVRSMCTECELLKFYEESCNIISAWFENGAHTETTQLLEQFCLSGGVFGNREFQNAARQRKCRGLKYIISRVLPPAQQVKGYYSNTSEENNSLAYYYVKRWISWFRRRKTLNKQVREIMSTEKSYIDKTDDLFRRMGLA